MRRQPGRLEVARISWPVSVSTAITATASVKISCTESSSASATSAGVAATARLRVRRLHDWACSPRSSISRRERRASRAKISERDERGDTDREQVDEQRPARRAVERRLRAVDGDLPVEGSGRGEGDDVMRAAVEPVDALQVARGLLVHLRERRLVLHMLEAVR